MTAGHCLWAPRVKTATNRRIQRARDLSTEDNFVARLIRIRWEGRREEGLGIRMQGIPVELLIPGHLDHLAQIHHAYCMTHVLDHRQIMGNQEIRQPEFLLEILEKVRHLRSD